MGSGKKERKGMNEEVLNEIVSPQMHNFLKKINTMFISVRNQMKMDGYEKEADKVWLSYTDLLNTIKKTYK